MLDSIEIKRIASQVGFDDCGIAKAQRLNDSFFPLTNWLTAGLHADMLFMERNTDKRSDPRLLMDGAQTVISLLIAYKPDRTMEGKAKIAQYAYGDDYHERLKQLMHSMISSIKDIDKSFKGRAFVDTAPISDRHWAVMAGLGSLGKNGLLIHPLYGSYCFIGEIVTTAQVDKYDKPQPDAFSEPCAGCRRCLDSCPNHAIVKLTDIAYSVDARRCTSYNTIENRNTLLPEGLDRQGYLFGCDICQLVCPANAHVSPAFSLNDDQKNRLENLKDADEEVFLKTTRHSALNRISYNQWRRNCEGIT